MSPWGRILGTASIAAGVIGAAALGGVTAQRRAVRKYRQDADEDPDHAYGALAADRSYSVVAEDGVALHVEEAGPLDAPLTVVFAHGWTLQSGAWHFQRLGLAGPDFGTAEARNRDGVGGLAEPKAESVEPEGGGRSGGRSHGRSEGRSGGGSGGGAVVAPSRMSTPAVRMVFYDQRSHGRSSRAGSGGSTLPALAADLGSVIATAAPTGPIVLVGHSMGGMALIALAGQEPDLFAERVVGVGLVSTAAGHFGIPGLSNSLLASTTSPLLRLVSAAAGRYPGLIERGRAGTHDAVWLLTRTLGFARADVPADVVDYLHEMMSGTPIDVIADFAPALMVMDESDSLAALTGIPAVIICGDSDRMTPPVRSESISQALPAADLVIIPRAGHMATLEAPAEVNAALRAMLVRAVACAHRRQLWSAK